MQLSLHKDVKLQALYNSKNCYVQLSLNKDVNK